MKILVLESSGNKKGSSNLLAEGFIQGAKENMMLIGLPLRRAATACRTLSRTIMVLVFNAIMNRVANAMAISSAA